MIGVNDFRNTFSNRIIHLKNSFNKTLPINLNFHRIRRLMAPLDRHLMADIVDFSPECRKHAEKFDPKQAFDA